MSVKRIFPKTTLKKIDVLSADGAFNVGCFVKNGQLIPALNSAKETNDILKEVNTGWYSAATKRYIVTGMRNVCVSAGEMTKPTMGIAVIDYPSMIEISSGGINTTIITGDTTYYSITADKCGNRPFKGAIHSCVLKNGRIFGIDNTNPYKIKWSGEGGAEDWAENISGAGWTIVQNGYGEILNLAVYKDKIVVIREFGLNLFSAYGTPENYKLSYPERKLPKIFPNTAAVLDDLLLFYTEDGLYTYDGNEVKKSSIVLAEEMIAPKFASCYRGVYYLCGESKTLERKAVLVVDAFKNGSYILDAPVNAVAAGERIFGYADGREYELEEGGKYLYTSGEIDFSSSGVKVLKEVIIDGTKDVEVEVSNGVISRIVGGIRGKFRPNMRGESFKITVCGSGKLTGVFAVAEVLNEV